MRFACLLLLPILALGLAGCPETTSCASGFMQVGDECVPIGSDAQVEDSGLDAGPACGGCADPTPICDPDSISCVACLGDGDCTDGMHCDTQDDTDATNNACVQCVTDTHCEGVAGAPNCGSDNMCFGCTGDVDCTDPNNAQCDMVSGECMPCSDSAHCAGVDGAGICDMSGESGVCVECNLSDDVACAQTCNLVTRSCSDIPARSVGECMPCTHDVQCIANHRCIQMDYMGEPHGEGGYCLKLASEGCNRPFLTPVDHVSIAGAASARYCGINETLTTCEAVNALLMSSTCESGMNDDCPQPGGICETVGVATNRCTYECAFPDDCPMTGGPSTCGDGGGGGTMYCGG